MNRPTPGWDNPPTTMLEEVFDFRDVNFSRYITIRSAGPDTLRALRDNMAESDHPLVVIAAGWAAAELAMYRPKFQSEFSRPRFDLEERLENLGTAQNMWESVGPAVSAWKSSQPSKERRLDVRNIDLRRKQALAYLPMMGIAASFGAREPFSPGQVAWHRDKTWRQSVQCGRVVLSLPGKDDLSRGSKAGMIAETLCGLTGQRDERQHHLVLPASLRQDHNPRARFRADFMALSTAYPHPKTPVFVNSTERAVEARNRSPSRHGVLFVAGRDFSLGPDEPPHRTLEALTQLEKGAPVAAETLAKLDAMAVTMTDRIDAFRQGYTP